MVRIKENFRVNHTGRRCLQINKQDKNRTRLERIDWTEELAICQLKQKCRKNKEKQSKETMRNLKNRQQQSCYLVLHSEREKF